MEIHLRHVVGKSVDQDRHVEAGPTERVGDGPLVAEIGQSDQHAVNGVAVFLEEIGAFLSIGQALNAAVLRLLRRQRDDFEALFLENAQHGLPSGLTKVAGEEAAVAYDEAKRDRFHWVILLDRDGFRMVDLEVNSEQ